MNAVQQNTQWSQIVARVWSDAAFKRRLLADPAAVLKEHGISMLPGVQVEVVEDTATMRYLILPAKPVGELAEAELTRVAGGSKHTGGVNA